MFAKSFLQVVLLIRGVKMVDGRYRIVTIHSIFSMRVVDVVVIFCLGNDPYSQERNIRRNACKLLEGGKIFR